MTKRNHPQSEEKRDASCSKITHPDEEEGSFSLDCIQVGKSLPIHEGYPFFELSSLYQPIGVQNYLFKDHIILSFIPTEDPQIQNGFVVDWKLQKILRWFVLEKDKVQSIMQYSLNNSIIDLSLDGLRWEGECESTTNQILGFGVLYNSENIMVYKGFRFGDIHFGYGTYYHLKTNCIEYEGMVANAQYCGKGKLYDVNGNLIHEGVFIGKSTNVDSLSLPLRPHQVFSSQAKTIEFDESYRMPPILFESSYFPFLESFVGTVMNFIKQPNFHFENHFKLKKIVFEGTNSYERVDWIPSSYGLYVKNCPQLTIISVCKEMFHYYYQFQIHDCPALSSITVDDYNFMYSVSELSISNCSKLKSIKIGKYSFCCCKSFTVDNLPSLQEFIIGSHSCSPPSRLMNEALYTFRNLPSLQKIMVCNSSFEYVGKVVFENTQVSMITPYKNYYESPWRNVFWMKEKNAPNLAQVVRERSQFYYSVSLLPISDLSSTLKEFVSTEVNHIEVKELDFSPYKRLKKIDIQRNSFPFCRSFKISGLKKLTTLNIGEGCFNFVVYDDEMSNYEILELSDFYNNGHAFNFSPSDFEDSSDRLNEQGMDAYDSNEFDRLNEQGMDAYDSNEFDRLDEQGMDAYDSDEFDRLDEQGMDAYDSDEDSSDEQGIDSYDSDEDLSDEQGIDSYDSDEDSSDEQSGESLDSYSYSEDDDHTNEEYIERLWNYEMSFNQYERLDVKMNQHVISNIMKSGREQSKELDDRFIKDTNEDKYPFLIENCPKLDSLSIHNDSFNDFTSFTLRNLPELYYIDVYRNSFQKCSSFNLINMKSLSSVSVYANSFIMTEKVVFANLPSLTQIDIDTRSFKGAYNRIEYNKLVMKNLCRLRLIILKESNFLNFGNVVVKNIGSKSLKLYCSDRPFMNVRNCSCDNSVIMNYIRQQSPYFIKYESYVDQDILCAFFQDTKLFSPSLKHTLQILKIAFFSWNKVSSLSLVDYSQLTKFLVGDMGLTHVTHFYSRNYWEKKSPLEIANCPLLREIRLGRTSCCNFSHFCVDGCDQLVTLEIGWYALSGVIDFRISNCRILRELHIPVHMGVIECLHIETLQDLVINVPFFVRDTDSDTLLIMKDLPKLMKLTIDDKGLKYLKHIVAIDIPELSKENITCKEKFYPYLLQMEFGNCSGLEEFFMSVTICFVCYHFNETKSYDGLLPQHFKT